MPQPRDDLSRSLVALDQHKTLIAVVELRRSSWLVGAIVPGVDRHPEKKLQPDEESLLRMLHRWRDEAARAGRKITRIAVAFEAGRDGFWLARWLRAPQIEAHVIHPTSIPVSREHGGRRQIGWMSVCSSALSLVGYAASPITAAW
jgi:transposase